MYNEMVTAIIWETWFEQHLLSNIWSFSPNVLSSKWQGEAFTVSWDQPQGLLLDPFTSPYVLAMGAWMSRLWHWCPMLWWQRRPRRWARDSKHGLQAEQGPCNVVQSLYRAICFGHRWNNCEARMRMWAIHKRYPSFCSCVPYFYSTISLSRPGGDSRKSVKRLNTGRLMKQATISTDEGYN